MNPRDSGRHDSGRNDGEARPSMGGRASDAPRSTEEYLWDRSGVPDPAVVELEHALSEHRLGASVPRDSRRVDAPAPRFVRRRPLMLALAAAAVLVLAGLVWVRVRGPAPSWEVQSLAGLPRVDGAGVTSGSRLGRGKWLETDSGSRATLGVASVGSLTVEPDSRVRLVESGDHEHRVELARGTVHAFITAPPRLFVVDTPSARAVDLGCVYTLRVAEDGSTFLSVSAGWVELVRGAIVSRVPSGAACRTDPSSGLGVPYFEDTSAAFLSALSAWEAGPRDGSVSDVLRAASGTPDAITLWHLVGRVSGSERARVVDRLAEFVPLPGGVARDRVMALEPAALESWWTVVRSGW